MEHAQLAAGVRTSSAADGPAEHDAVRATVGREAISKRIGGPPGISKIELRIRHIGVVDGVVFIERVDDFVYRGHHGTVPVVGVVEVAQGHVTAWREYYDRAQMIEALGLQQDFDAAAKQRQ